MFFSQDFSVKNETKFPMTKPSYKSHDPKKSADPDINIPVLNFCLRAKQAIPNQYFNTL